MRWTDGLRFPRGNHTRVIGTDIELAHREDGATGMAQHGAGDPADEEMGDAASAMGAHDHKIIGMLGDVGRDRISRQAWFERMIGLDTE